ncbi:MAG: CoA transferase [Clostridioides sp.]|nr:CoA transferase [Clostridioides sp.]
MKKPLEGIRVVEMGTYVAVPKAARMLADWGAEVIKVEAPSGDSWRVVGLSYNMPCEEDNCGFFQAPNAGKKGICLNLKSEKGKKIFDELLSTADIFMTNTRPRPLSKLGIDYETLKEKYPRLIYGYFTAYGEKGPDVDKPGFDLAAFWAKSGALVQMTPAEISPPKPGPGFGDSAVASSFVAGMLAALINREKTGLGDKVEVSLYSSGLFYNSETVLMGQPQFENPYPKKRNESPSPTTPLYQSKDGDWFLVSQPKWDSGYKTLLSALKMDEYIDDPRFYPLTNARKHMGEVIDLITEAFSKLSSEELLKNLQEIDIVHAKLTNPRELYSDPQGWENKYLEEVTLRSGKKIVTPTNPVQFQNIEQTPARLAPLLGEDTDSVLESLGYSKEEIETMAAEKVIVHRSPKVEEALV